VSLAKETGKQKRSRQIYDFWPFNYTVIFKTIDGVLKEVRLDVDLNEN